MQINKNRLYSDLINMDKFFKSNPSASSITNEYGWFLHQENMFYELTGYSMDLNGLFLNPREIQNRINRYEDKNGDVFSQIFINNADFLIDAFNNFCEFMESIKFEMYPFYDTCKKYNENDFKNILFSFFSQYGKDDLKIVRKYFDENRIMTGAYFLQDCGGMYMPSIFNKSGYIGVVPDGFDTNSISVLAHELGHAIDFEKFIYPQQKKYSTISDVLLEVPSMTYEFAMLDFLVKNKIDEIGSRVIYNRNLIYLFECANVINEVFSHHDIIINNAGDVLLEDGTYYNVRNHIIYGLATMFSLYLNKIREEDPVLYKKVFNDLCTMRCENSLEDSINLLGISMDEFASGRLVSDKIESETKVLKKKFKF